jgi:hypothetical protein
MRRLAGHLEESMHSKDYLMFFVGDLVRRYRDVHGAFQGVRNLRIFRYPYFKLPEIDDEPAAEGQVSGLIR